MAHSNIDVSARHAVSLSSFSILPFNDNVLAFNAYLVMSKLLSVASPRRFCTLFVSHRVARTGRHATKGKNCFDERVQLDVSVIDVTSKSRSIFAHTHTQHNVYT